MVTKSNIIRSDEKKLILLFRVNETDSLFNGFCGDHPPPPPRPMFCNCPKDAAADRLCFADFDQDPCRQQTTDVISPEEGME
jgi:hypothetical protein